VQFHGFSGVPPNDKRLIFNHRSILKEISVFVNKVENKQKETRLQVQVKSGQIFACAVILSFHFLIRFDFPFNF